MRVDPISVVGYGLVQAETTINSDVLDSNLTGMCVVWIGEVDSIWKILWGFAIHFLPQELCPGLVPSDGVLSRLPACAKPSQPISTSATISPMRQSTVDARVGIK